MLNFSLTFTSEIFLQLEIVQMLLWVNRWKACLTGSLNRVTTGNAWAGEKQCCKATAESCYARQLVLSLIVAEGIQHGI